MKKDESVYLGRLQRLGCMVCRMYEEMGVPQIHGDTVIHHMRASEGGAQRAQNWLTIPLCVYDHTGSRGIHGDRSRIRFLKLDEHDLLALTIEAYFQTYGF